MPLVTAQVPITALRGEFVFEPGAECGGNHIKQAADNGGTRFQTSQYGCLSGDFPRRFRQIRQQAAGRD